MKKMLDDPSILQTYDFSQGVPGKYISLLIDVARKQTPTQRLSRALAMNDEGRELLEAGIRHQHPEYTEQQVQEVLLQRLALCHNRNY